MRYKINIYHGGEGDDETWYAKTISDAKRIAFRGEHQEIIDTKTNKIIEI
tara:strand:+ start:24984 stop:25133 length:150 start_codon:yes stop_codon:yes gene_type:complete